MPQSLVYSRQRKEAADESVCNGEMICHSCSDVHSEMRLHGRRCSEKKCGPLCVQMCVRKNFQIPVAQIPVVCLLAGVKVASVMHL